MFWGKVPRPTPQSKSPDAKASAARAGQTKKERREGLSWLRRDVGKLGFYLLTPVLEEGRQH